MYYGNIKTNDIADGEGVRVALFVSGCRNCCKGCFNQESWNFRYGKPFTAETEQYIISALEPEHISGLSVLGGEPFEPENQLILYPFLKRVRERYPQKTIWCYTGYIWDRDIAPSGGRRHCSVTDDMLSLIDVLVDGPFIEEQKNLMLRFRGSMNQRLLVRSGDTFKTENHTGMA